MQTTRRFRGDQKARTTEGWRPGILLAVAAAVGSAAGVVRGEILYDTTWMTDQQSYDAQSPCYIGGFAINLFFTDVQTADDFDLFGTYEITLLTSDYRNGSPDAFPAHGVLVEFFADLGGTPSETPSIQVLTSAVTETFFEDTVFGNSGHRLTVDLSGEGITLSPGTWWVSIVPVDETRSGVNYNHLRTVGLLNGELAHARDGGMDHGTGYAGIWGTDDWTPFGDIGGAGDGDVAMKIEGTAICVWDLDGNETVSTADLLALLSAWGTDPGGPPDFDGDGNVGTADLLALLANWGPC